jgi:hypothetical protein
MKRAKIASRGTSHKRLYDTSNIKHSRNLEGNQEEATDENGLSQSDDIQDRMTEFYRIQFFPFCEFG